MIAVFTRYEKNTNAFSREEVEKIHGKSVCIVGCGGLGGYVAMSLARFGVRSLTLVDGDEFTASNLNRQLFCTEANLGRNKAEETQKALALVNSDVEVTAITENMSKNNCGQLLDDCDAAVDCLDNILSRFDLEERCKEADIPLIHGAVSGFFGQAACVFPGDDLMRAIYAGGILKLRSNAAGAPPFIPQLVAAIECSETLKILAGRGDVLRHKLLTIDLLRNDFQILEFSRSP